MRDLTNRINIVSTYGSSLWANKRGLNMTKFFVNSIIVNACGGMLAGHIKAQMDVRLTLAR